MKKYFLVSFIGLAGLVLASPSSIIDDKFIDALMYVESMYNHHLVGDNGRSKGILQISDKVIRDVNRIYCCNYQHDDSFNPGKSRSICKLYLTYYLKSYEKKSGKNATIEVAARIWNGGPNGYKNPKTIRYWTRVRNRIESH